MTAIIKRRDEIIEEFNTIADKCSKLAEQKIEIQNEMTEYSVQLDTLTTELKLLNGNTTPTLKHRKKIQCEINIIADKCAKIAKQKNKIRTEMTEYSVQMDTLTTELKSLRGNITVASTIEKLCDEEEKSAITTSKAKKSTEPHKVGHIYLLIEREFIKTKEPIYKIGKTINVTNRMTQYPKGSNVIVIFTVSDIDKIEKDVIKKFDNLFKNRSDIGREYYEGNIEKMKQVLCDVCLEK